MKLIPLTIITLHTYALDLGVSSINYINDFDSIKLFITTTRCDHKILKDKLGKFRTLILSIVLSKVQVEVVQFISFFLYMQSI